VPGEVTRIEVHGLKEFRRNLRQMDRGLPKGLRVAGNKAAALVVAGAKPLVPLGPARGGHARDSIRAASTQSSARVKGGGSRFPYYPWLDFGGRVGRNRSVHRRFIHSGRYIWAAFARDRHKVERELLDALEGVARDAGVRVR
jgi:hypothetical protein